VVARALAARPSTDNAPARTGVVVGGAHPDRLASTRTTTTLSVCKRLLLLSMSSILLAFFLWYGRKTGERSICQGVSVFGFIFVFFFPSVLFSLLSHFDALSANG
jgi:hypothetical protein